MKLSRHVAVSASMAAIIWYFSKSLYTGLICFISGSAVDADHIIEYIIHYGYKGLSIKGVYQACHDTTSRTGDMRFERLFLIFHSGEFALLLWALFVYTGNMYLLSAALGYSMHLIMDILGNPMYPRAYFITWRFLKNFETYKLFR